MGNMRKLPKNGPAPENVAPALGDDPAALAAMQRQADELNAWMAYLQDVRPVPVRFRVAAIEHRDHEGATRKGVQLVAATPTGPIVLMLTPELADELAALLTKHSAIAHSGLIIPT